MSRLTDPVELRSVPVSLIPRDCVFLPAVRIEAGWSIEIEGRWFRVVGEPALLGDGEDEDGGRVRFMVTGPGVEVVDLSTYRRGERVWARAPRPQQIETLGCARPECAAEGPFTLTDDGLLCRAHLGEHALAETAGSGPDPEPEADRG